MTGLSARLIMRAYCLAVAARARLENRCRAGDERPGDAGQWARRTRQIARFQRALNTKDPRRKHGEHL